MSRQSSDEFDREGRLKSGFDYDKQCWVLDYVIQDCGHPKIMDCRCYGRQHEGERTDSGSVGIAR